jgi:hypothetical protein
VCTDVLLAEASRIQEEGQAAAFHCASTLELVKREVNATLVQVVERVFQTLDSNELFEIAELAAGVP